MQNKIKTVIINSAVPGSGKTTISNCIIQYLKKKGISVSIHSTDRYFMTKDGTYNFILDKLQENHLKNLSVFTTSLKNGEQVVICDNINLSPWQTEPYTDLAREYGYSILFISFAPRELEKHVQSQQVTPDKPDAHGVPKKVLERFISEYNNYVSLLDSSTPIDPVRHKHYKWDCKTQTKIETEQLCKHFELDDRILINPSEYHEIKGNIGKRVFQFISEGASPK